MAQKNFATAPKLAKQPTDDQIAAFERGGTGHDKHSQRASKPTAAKVKTEPTKALFMTVWRPSTRSAENSCGIRQG